MKEKPLLFDWSTDPGWNWRLAYFVAFSLIAHLTVFYLFQVAYPPVERWTPRTTGVMLLSSTNPITSQVLRELHDHTFYLTHLGGTEIPEYSLDAQFPKFRPSFSVHEIPLQLKAPVEVEPGLPTLFRPGRADFPPLPAAPVRIAGEGAKPDPGRWRVRLSGPLADRPWKVEENGLPGILAEVNGGDWRRIRAYVKVTPAGRIELLLPAETDGDVSQAAVSALRKGVRFHPAEDASWGWIEVTR